MQIEMKAIEELPEMQKRAERNVMDISKYATKSDAMRDLITIFIEQHKIGQPTYERWRDKIAEHFRLHTI